MIVNGANRSKKMKYLISQRCKGLEAVSCGRNWSRRVDAAMGFGIRQCEQDAQAIRTPANDWKTFYLLSGSPDRILLASFKSEKPKPLTGKTLGSSEDARQTSAETIMDRMLEDRSRIGTIYFLMTEDNIRKQIRQPWVSFGSHAASIAPEGVF